LRPDADEQSRQDDQQQIQWIEIKHKSVQWTARSLFSFNQAGRVPGRFPANLKVSAFRESIFCASLAQLRHGFDADGWPMQQAEWIGRDVHFSQR
jgi:hypothetical protein